MKDTKASKSTPKKTKKTQLPFDPTSLLSVDSWLRLLYMMFFGAIGYLVCMGILLIALFQFAAFLLSGKKNANLLELSENLCDYIREIFTYLTFLHDNKPFPFSKWSGK